MSHYSVDAKQLTSTNLSAFGKPVFLPADTPPDSAGTGWQCWYPTGTLQGTGNLQIGIVRVDLGEARIAKVEMHPTREEYVYAMESPIVQVMALGSEASGELADPKTAVAVLIRPGEGIIIHPGVWHAPAFAASLTQGYYGFILGAPDPAVSEKGLVEFWDGSDLQINLHNSEA